MKIAKRILSLILCLAILLVYAPYSATQANAAAQGDRITDPHTLDQWMQYFGSMENHSQNVSLSTEFAGGVWTDKSVFLPGQLPTQLTAATYNGQGISVEDTGDNFVVALSALASNKQIRGYSTIPTDTVLVLDLSSSMRRTDNSGSSAVDELAEAANTAIAELLALNKNNRVAVVVYAGNTSRSFSNADGITRVLLPLDSYTTSANGVYLESVTVNRTPNDGLRVSSSVRNSSNQSVSNSTFQVSTGTYMQDGIYEAMRLLLAADPVVDSGVQTGTARIPITVLMTDGEPTLGNPDYNGKDDRTDLGTSTLYNYNGTTGSYSHRDALAFLTSLTAAYAQKQITAHYGVESLMYTLSYGEQVQSLSEARSVLNPAEASAIQNQLWTDFLDGKDVIVERSGNRNNYTYVTVSNSSVAGETLTIDDRLYVDKYFPAASDEEMLAAFAAIVNEILIQSKYYPTYVEQDYDHDGYLTFVDKIGSYMEVSGVEGIVIGNRLFSGAALAKSLSEGDLGDVTDPSIKGKELIASICARLGADTDEALVLLQNAIAHGQLRYTDDTDFEHYIGWFSDKDGNYIDFWHENMTDEQIRSAVETRNATHIIRSYGFLGDTAVVPGIATTDMMFMSVRIATEIATGESIITWRIPASLVPTVTYEVEIEMDGQNQISQLTALELASNSATSPIRLVYSVGLRSDITDWNMTEKVSADYVAANGYTFYSNKWSSDPEDTSLNTYSHFEPSLENERYYYTQDTTVLQKNGEDYTPYTGSQPSGSGYYHSYPVFEKLENGSLRIHTHYEPISAEAMDSVTAGADGQWVIPKGTIHRYYDYEITDKTENATATMAHSDHPFVVKSDSIYYTYSTQGNNGRFTATPATGIRLHKALAEGFQSDAAFTFRISGNTANAVVVRLDAEGSEASRTALDASGEVTLQADETVYILGLSAGSYTVAEVIPEGADYGVRNVTVEGQLIDGIQADLTLSAQTIADVVFTNDARGYGSLVISKDVTYPEGFSPTAAHNEKAFTLLVTFQGETNGMTVPQDAVANGNVYTLSLRSGDTRTFSHIPEGVTYEVTEINIPTGYVNTDIRLSNGQKVIRANTLDEVHVINRYEPAPVSVDLELNGTKTVTGGWPADASFRIRLWETTEQMTDTGLYATVTEANSAYRLDLSSISFDAPGVYSYTLLEDIPEDRIPDMAYDRSYGKFTVTVTDTDADGQLEIASVTAENAQLNGDAQTGYTITKDFNNVVTRDIVYLDIHKQLADANDPTISYTQHLNGITFGLFASMNDETPVYYVLTDDSGKAAFAIPVSQDGLGQNGAVYYLREIAPGVENRVVGMHYDESWIGALRITWDDASHVAVTEFALMENGTLGAYAPYDPAAPVIHTNLFEADIQSTPALELSGTKTLNGSTDLGGREFQFHLYQTSSDFVIQGEALQTVTNNGSVIAFEGITFRTPGMHYLSVKEAPTTLGGVTVDENHYHITVLVEKYVAADGITRLKIADGYPQIHAYGAADPVAVDGLDFHNTYRVSGTAQVVIDGTKTLTGRPMQNGEFRFRLTQTDSQGNPISGGVSLDAENGTATGTNAQFLFPAITYDEAGEYYYRVVELAGTAANGITYSQESFTVKVTVSDNGNGGLVADWAPVGTDAIVFHNYYQPQATFTELLSTKELTGKVLVDGQFQFRLTETDADFTTAKENGVQRTVSNNIHGAISFGQLSYTQPDTHYYRIEEVNGGTTVDGITYDSTVYHVTVQVIDNHRGSLVTLVSIELVREESGTVTKVPTASIVFHNEYNITGEAGLTLSGTKTLQGGDLTDGAFTFELYTTDENYGTEGITPETAGNQSGAFEFSLNYTPEDAGNTFYYLLAEKNGGQTLEGITYDDTHYRIRVEVEDDGKGGLTASFFVNENPEDPTAYNFTFTNTVVPPVEPEPPLDPNPTDPEPTEPEPTEPAPTEPPASVTPETGDSTNLPILLALSFTSLVALVVLLLAGKKRTATK